MDGSRGGDWRPERPGRAPDINVFGDALEICSRKPLTGFFRDGCCGTGPQDRGMHTVCAELTAEFLAFSKKRGNDLSTPRPEYAFPGLKPGDRWCLCALRWLEAHEAGQAPKVRLAATHANTLEVIPLSVLKPYAVDLT